MNTALNLIQQFSTEDGPGIHTTVFMEECPLRCVWCHNPEGASQHPDLMWSDARCIAARVFGKCAVAHAKRNDDRSQAYPASG